MDKKKLIWGAFGVMVLLQLGVPFRWIYQHEKVLQKGTPFKFRLDPVDPSDPFRGNYMTLEYEADSVPVEAPGAWDHGDRAYVSFDTTDQGFVRLLDVSQRPFGEDVNYFLSEVDAVHRLEGLKRGWIRLEHPFDRYFLPKAQARNAEERLWSPSEEGPSYAVVRIMDGKACLEELIVQGKPADRIIEE